MRRIKKEECWHRGLLKQKRIKQNAKEKKRSGMQKERTKAEIQREK